jgi:HK97 gp10 family phage protein
MTRHVTGVENVLRAIGKAKKKTGDRIEDALEKCANVILRKSQEYVPVETGELKASGHVEKEGKGLGAKSRVVYGGDPAPYALYVHEDLEKKHAPPTCAKFLTRAVRETRGTCANILKREMEARPVKTIDQQEVE